MVVIVGIMALSIAWYYFPIIGGVHWFKGPVTTIETVPMDGMGMKGKTDSDSYDGDEVVEVESNEEKNEKKN